MSYAQAITSAPAPLYFMWSCGISDAARSLQSEFVEKFTKPDLDELHQRLVRALSAATVPVPVTTLAAALAFVSSLPADVYPPDVWIEEDGEIAFDWQEERDLVLSVVVKHSSQLGYAALIGADPTYGRARFTGTLPSTVAHLVDRFSVIRSGRHRSERENQPLRS